MYERGDCTLTIEIATYGFDSRVDREWPRFQPPAGAENVPIGEEGLCWSIGQDQHVVYFQEWKVIVYSTLSVGEDDIGREWLIYLMERQETAIEEFQ